MEKVVLKAEVRQPALKAADCRKEGNIPAVIYNHGKTDLLKLNAREIAKEFAPGISESRVYSLEIGDKNEEAFIKDYQIHPLSGEIMHVDFFRITYGEKVKTHIPIHLEGKSIGEKEGGALEIFAHDVEIEILPRHLVPSINVDISNLKMGDAIHAEDLNLPESAKLLVEGNPVICHVSTPTRAKAAEETEEEKAGEEAASQSE